MFEFYFVCCTVILICWSIASYIMNNDKKAHFDGKPFLDIKTNNAKSKLLDNVTNGCEAIINKSNKFKERNSFANISNKKICGANNWLNFVKTQSQNNIPSSMKRKVAGIQASPINSEIKKLKMASKKKEELILSTVPLHNKSGKNISVINHDIDGVNNKPNSNLGIFLPKHVKEDGNFNLREPAVTKLVAMDCEMVGVDLGINNNMLARVSLVNAMGDCIYDKYVKPTEPVVDYRTHVSGIRPKDLMDAHEFNVVQKEVADIIKGKILIGHALKNDLSVLYLTHPKRLIRDTSRFKRFNQGKTPALKQLAKKFLGVTIQEGEHSSIQDASAAMQLYRMFRKEWEESLRPCKNKKQHIHKNKTSEIQYDF